MGVSPKVGGTFLGPYNKDNQDIPLYTQALFGENVRVRGLSLGGRKMERTATDPWQKQAELNSPLAKLLPRHLGGYRK